MPTQDVYEPLKSAMGLTVTRCEAVMFTVVASPLLAVLGHLVPGIVTFFVISLFQAFPLHFAITT